MVYRVIGVAGAPSLQGLEIIFAELTETGGKWEHSILAAATYALAEQWKEKLDKPATLSIPGYRNMDASFGRYIGKQVNDFIQQHNLVLRVHLIASDGYPLILPADESIPLRIGHGAYIAAETGLPVVSDLLSLDLAFGGQGAPLVAITEKLLPATEIPSYSETLAVALMGILRWREETNMLSSVTGARRDSVGGALWLGTEA